MELLFVTLGGAIIGLAARYSTPRRDTNGAVLVPAIGASSAAIVWAVLTWVGLKFDGGWIWVASLVCSALVAAIVAIVVGQVRTRSDAELLARLNRA